MAAITKGLLAALPARAPEVAFASLNINFVGRVLRGFTLTHQMFQLTVKHGLWIITACNPTRLDESANGLFDQIIIDAGANAVASVEQHSCEWPQRSGGLPCQEGNNIQRCAEPEGY